MVIADLDRAVVRKRTRWQVPANRIVGEVYRTMIHNHTDRPWLEHVGELTTTDDQAHGDRHPFALLILASIGFSHRNGAWPGAFLENQAADGDKRNEPPGMKDRRQIYVAEPLGRSLLGVKIREEKRA